jgi:predicted ester cyclase
MTTTDANKQIVEQFITALFTDGDLTAATFREVFPDWRSDLEQLIAENDLVAENFIAHGTHRGSLMGETPTGREMTLRGVNIFRVAGGKIVERWGRLDHLGLLQQLGLAPAATGS